MAALPKPFNQLGVLDKLIPYPPYLFLLCANILSIAPTQAENSKQIKGVSIGRHGVSFTHLFFFQSDHSSLTNLKRIILWYCSISGQCITFPSQASTALLTFPIVTKKILQTYYQSILFSIRVSIWALIQI